MGDKNQRFADAQTVDQQRIPIIDLTSVLGTSPSSISTHTYQKVGAAIHAAAQEVGFFYVTGHGIDQSIIEAALSSTQDFFNLDEKHKSTVTVDQTQKGWMRSGMANLEGAKTHDLKEVFFYGREIDANDPDLASRLPMVSRNRWPDTACPALKDSVMAYHAALCEVGGAILSAIAVEFNLSPTFFKPYYDRPLARGQLVYYPPSTELDEQEQRYGVAPHTDFGVLTLLYQDTSGGLQVKSKVDGWIEAPPIDGTLVCNTGDLLQRWTGGLFSSTVHRVINRSGRARFSMPLFFDPNSDAVIDANDLGIQKTTKIPPVRAGEHIASRNSKNFSQYK